MDSPPTKKIKGSETGTQTEPNMGCKLNEESFKKHCKDTDLKLMERLVH